MLSYQIFPLESLFSVKTAVLAALLILAAWYDIKQRTIPNWLTFGGLAMLLVISLVQSPNTLLSQAQAWLVAIILFGGLFYARMFGGGDAKLLMVLSFAVGLPFLVSLYLWIFLCGGLQALITHYLYKQKTMPYAVAIAAGFAFYWLSSLILHQLQ